LLVLFRNIPAECQSLSTSEFFLTEETLALSTSPVSTDLVALYKALDGDRSKDPEEGRRGS